MRPLFAAPHVRRPSPPRVAVVAAVLAGVAGVVPPAAAQDAGGFSARGYVHYDMREFNETAFAVTGESSEVRRVRPILEYKSEHWSARFMPDLMRETNYTLEAYVDFTPEGPWDVRIGRFKSPLSIDRLRSSNALTLVENSVVAAMTPNYDNGVQVGFETEGKANWRFEGAVFDGAADDEVKGSLDSDVEVTLRALRNQPVGAGKLRLGVALSHGKRAGEPGDARLARYRTSGRSTWFRYVGGAFSDGDAQRFVAFADYHGGPWFAQAEVGQSGETVRFDGLVDSTTAELRHRGWEVQGSRVLTGEERKPGGVTPGNLRLPVVDLPVAVELGAHVGQVRIDGAAFDRGLAPTDGNGERLRVAGVSLGLWFPKQWRLTVNYEDSRIDIAGGGNVREKVWLGRVGISF